VRTSRAVLTASAVLGAALVLVSCSGDGSVEPPEAGASRTPAASPSSSVSPSRTATPSRTAALPSITASVPSPTRSARPTEPAASATPVPSASEPAPAPSQPPPQEPEPSSPRPEPSRTEPGSQSPEQSPSAESGSTPQATDAEALPGGAAADDDAPAGESDASSVWWWLLAALALALAVGVPLLRRTRRRHDWADGLSAAESEVGWMARELMPGLADSGSLEASAGAWAISLERVDALETALAELERTAYDDAGRLRARFLLDAVRRARSRVDDGLRGGDRQAFTTALFDVVADLEAAAGAAAPTSP
jgi:hypothetical protein